MTLQERAIRAWMDRKIPGMITPLKTAGNLLDFAEGKNKWRYIRRKIRHDVKTIAILRRIMRTEGVRP